MITEFEDTRRNCSDAFTKPVLLLHTDSTLDSAPSQEHEY